MSSDDKCKANRQDNPDLETAVRLLAEKNAACVFVGNGKTIVLYEKGVAALLKLVDSKEDISGTCAADKVIGKAAAFLHVLLGVSSVYAKVISKAAMDVFSKAGISVKYDKEADRIVNRNGTGFCPMETAVIDVTDPQEAFRLLKEKMEQLQNNEKM